MFRGRGPRRGCAEGVGTFFVGGRPFVWQVLELDQAAFGSSTCSCVQPRANLGKWNRWLFVNQQQNLI